MERETLADYVRRVRHAKRLTLHDVEKNSGGGITNSYTSRIENGYVTNVTPEKLQALAKGLGVSEQEIFDVARGKVAENGLESSDFAALYYEYSELPEQARREVTPIKDAVFEVFRAEIRRRKAEQEKAKGT